ncbi:ribosome small subunit-dependent GTPase A [Treponema phagedenis]|nr:ribosome small subunit-dependent GTPase A [Treponema phagedenis]
MGGDSLIRGKVLCGANNFFDVSCEDGTVRYCSIRGKKLEDPVGYYNPLAPGDFVLVDEDTHDKEKGQIVSLEKRKNHFVRWNQKTDKPQILACNIDLLVCVTSPANPPFRPRFIDRVLVQAEAEQIPVLIVINKTDLDTTDEVRLRINDWERIGYETLKLSALNNTGVERFAKRIEGLTVAIIGQSGVGKSTLLNSLDPTLNLRTAEISSKYDRGIHTTTQGILLKATHRFRDGTESKTEVIDTPGIRHFAIWGMKPDELALYFPEMQKLLGTCTFGLSCSHTHEEGCAILHALENGGIHPDRYESWRLISEELEALTAEDYS